MKNYLECGGIVFLFLLHSFVLAGRFYTVIKFEKVLPSIEEVKDVYFWLNLFRFGSFMTGVVWGSVFLLLNDLSPSYHFFMLSVIIGIAAVGMSTIGAVLSVYLAFIIPMYCIIVMWMLFQNDEIHFYAAFLMSVGFLYLYVSVRRFAKEFRELYEDGKRIEHYTAELEDQYDTFETLFEKSSDGILIIEDDKFTQCNEKVLEMFKYSSKEEILQKHPSDISPKFQADGKSSLEKAQMMMDLAVKNGSHKFEWMCKKSDDVEFLSELTLSIIKIKDKNVIYSVVHDISKKREDENRIKHLAQMIEQTHDAVISTDLNGNILSWNYGAKIIFGYNADDVIGKHISILYPKEDKELSHDIEKLMEDGEYHIEAYRVKKNGELVYTSLSLSLLKDENSKPIRIVGYSQDVTKRKKYEDEMLKQKEVLHYQATHDFLTSLPNRVLFNDRLEQAIETAKRNKTKFALLFLDLDHFKEINDSLGHDAGDEILKEVAKRLENTIRDEDTLARLGGDEFTIIMQGLKDGQNASILAQKIIKVLSIPIMVNNIELHISNSIGISIYPDDGISAQNLLKYADAAMYKAKNEGRDNFQFYSVEMTELAFERVAMEMNLRDAIKNDEFVVYYQPQVCGENDELIGMEALVRWKHPSMGLISPNKFIPIAESSGLIVEIDRFVMKSAMEQFVKWYEDGFNPGVLSLNLAMKQLQREDFIPTLKKLMKETCCKAEWIELEITESQIMIDLDKSVGMLNQVNELGIELAIDDFGTGYSSLSYLKKLPISKLKIDQSFVRDLPDDEEDIAITRAVIALAKSLNLKIIAEGVETIEQKDFLIENGCKNIQGYYYSKPTPVDGIGIILKDGLV